MKKINELEKKAILMKQFLLSYEDSKHFSINWVQENILGIKDKAKDRKIKIKRILKDE